MKIHQLQRGMVGLLSGTLLFTSAAVVAHGGQEPSTIRVTTADGLTQAVRQAKPGTTIRIAPGTYQGGILFAGVRGVLGKPIVIAAADPKNPPVFRGGGTVLQFSGAAYLSLRDLTLVGATGNGLNMDDGGERTKPSHHITLRNITVREIGPRGNCDGIKLSGLADFRVENCTIEQWGSGGQGIDMVGCHRGLIEGCTLRHTDEENPAGVQTKGGSRNITIRGCRFENAGGRAVNIGGSTGLEFFRPPLDLSPGTPGNFEAADITVEGNTFIGSSAPIAFVGVSGATVRRNTIYLPKRWAIRILQETTEPSFLPSRNGTFTDNLIVFRSDQWGSGGVNIGPKTAPDTFTFAQNFWYCQDNPKNSHPQLPTLEKNGVYGTDPQLTDPAKGDFRPKAGSPAGRYGAHSLPRSRK